MQFSLALTALFMGLVGGPHCVAMCGAACAGLGQAAGSHRNSALVSFQVGRVLGYSVLGALAAATLQGLGWLTVQSVALRPLWGAFHAATLVLGLLLMLRGQQPLWLDLAGRWLWQRARGSAANHLAAPLLLGSLWALLPCGLLYSALLVAAMAGGPLEGAVVMAAFAIGTSVSMGVVPWLWLRLRAPAASGGAAQWGVRLAGAALAASSGWALWMGLARNAAPWCVS